MTISGIFKTLDEQHIISVAITSSALPYDIIIGNDNSSHVYFSDDPVQIESNCDTTFDVVIGHRATINLVTDIWLGDYLFANKVTSIPVQITMDNVNIFDGYLEHNTYSQQYAHTWDTITLNCIDHLLAAESQTMSDSTDYDTLKSAANIHTFKSLMQTILGDTVNIYFDGSKRVYQSQSTLTYDIFNNLSISDNSWLGDCQDDLLSNKQIIEEMLKYLNLHIVQAYDYADATKPYAFYIFDWDYIFRKNNTTGSKFMYNVRNGGTYTGMGMPIIDVVANMYMSDDSNVTIDSVYNKISVKVSPNVIDTIITNPLETDDLDSPYSDYSRYMTEFFATQDSLGKDKPWEKFRGMIVGVAPNWDNANDGWFRHWYMRYMNNPKWALASYLVIPNSTSPTQGWEGIEDGTMIFPDGTGIWYNASTEIDNNENQWCVPKGALFKGTVTHSMTSMQGQTYTKTDMTGLPIYNKLYPFGEGVIPGTPANMKTDIPRFMPMVLNRKGNCIGAVIMNLWSTDKINTKDSNTVTRKCNESTSLIITTNNICSGDVVEAMKSSGGALATYVVNTASSFMPTNNDVTYYLAFTGKVVFKPFTTGICDYERVKNDTTYNTPHKVGCSYHFGGEKGGLYTRVFYDTQVTQADLGVEYNRTNWVEPTQALGFNSDMWNIAPYMEDDAIEQWEYKAVDNIDTLDKVGVVECSLRIGDKYLSEGVVTKVVDGETVYYPNNDYTWTTDQTATFTIGFDPKDGDFLVGKQHDIGTDISAFMNVDIAKAMLIPIHRSDNLSGDIEFKIISPVNICWDDNYRKHKTWFRHSRQWTNVKTILCDDTLEQQTYTTPLTSMYLAIESIQIDELKCTLYSDSGGSSILKENDIVYMSDEQNKYVEQKDDIELKFMSGLTQAEVIKFGVTDNSSDNYVLDYANAPITDIVPSIPMEESDHTPITKPEKLYCAQYWDEYKQPKIIFETTLKYEGEQMMFNRYRFSYFNGKTFYPMTMTTGLKFQTTTLKIKEC